MAHPPLPADLAALPVLPGAQETAWIEVIRKMEEVYSDLLRYEVDLEEKNAALEEAQRFITSVLSSMSDVLVVSDSKGRVRQVNAAFLDLTGLSEAEVLDQPAESLFAEADRPKLGRLREALRDCEVRLKARRGLTEPVSLNGSTRFDQRKRPAGMVLIGRPVGELRRAYEALNKAHADLKEAQQRLIQAEKMASLGRLVAGVAHELNNPISFVYGNIHTLQRYRQRLIDYLQAIHGGIGEAERDSLRHSLRIDHILDDLQPLIEGTLEGATRVSEIVKNLRRLSFTAAGEPESVDLAILIRTAAHWASKASRCPAPIALSLPEPLLVRGHSGQLHQVMVNLVQNALDALEGIRDPAIAISAAVAAEIVMVRVRDNGSGIKPEHLLKVFDPFFTTKPVGQGTGLGLWISYGIVKDHGGMLEAVNAAGGGAEFIITLPAS